MKDKRKNKTRKEIEKEHNLKDRGDVNKDEILKQLEKVQIEFWWLDEILTRHGKDKKAIEEILTTCIVLDNFLIQLGYCKDKNAKKIPIKIMGKKPIEFLMCMKLSDYIFGEKE